jgi:hypothetical protein
MHVGMAIQITKAAISTGHNDTEQFVWPQAVGQRRSGKPGRKRLVWQQGHSARPSFIGAHGSALDDTKEVDHSTEHCSDDH